jgi:hypothetical protein
MHKIVRGMIAFYAPEDACRSTDEAAFLTNEVSNIKIPKTYLDANRDSSHAQDWQQAIQEERQLPTANGTWKEVIISPSANLVSMKWVYTVKTMVDGSIERCKARLVARGFSQAYDLDYDKTFAPTIMMDILRLFLAIIAFKNLECWHFNIKDAFTESELQEKSFFQPPPRVKVRPGYVLQALRSLYGLKQAARDWHDLINAELIKWGFEQSPTKPCLFVNHSTRVMLLVYADDIAAAAKSKIQLERFFETLSTSFNTKNLGKIENILEARVTHDRKNRTLFIDQDQYLTIVLDRFGITAVKQKKQTSRKIPPTDYELLHPADDKDVPINMSEYQQGIRILHHAMLFTCPDIAFVLSKLSQYMSDPGRHRGHALKNRL